MKKSIVLIGILSMLWSCTKQDPKSTVLVADYAELSEALRELEPGDEIVMKNGVWRDVTLEMVGYGTDENPIVLRAETPGEVFIEGKSSLKLGGEYLEVRDLFFRNGYTPENSIIQFRINKDLIANNSKVTNCVIYEFTQPNRHNTDHWIEFWGRHNELSHCYIAGKSNFGPTVMVMLKGNEHAKNYHKISGNHFGPRPRKGGPHGETMQIGDSGTSMVHSFTQVEGNLFERCNGEVEIISSKSNYNSFKHNIFYKSEGSLVLRHGNYATIDGNVFIGSDQSDNIGGIRVINTGHWITNNYFYKLKGKSFRAPLAIMNGIPKSPLNRYNQVTDVVVAFNSYIDCDTPFHISVGSNVSQADVLPKSEIRSARPIRTTIANNLLMNTLHNADAIYAYDKIDGINFQNNVANPMVKTEQPGVLNTDNLETKLVNGDYKMLLNDEVSLFNGFDFNTIDIDLFGNSRNAESNRIGAIVGDQNKLGVSLSHDRYGASWYQTEDSLKKPSTTKVSNWEELSTALIKSEPSDTIILMAGDYVVKKTLTIGKPITIKSESPEAEVNLIFNDLKTAFEFKPKGQLNVEHLNFYGDNKTTLFSPMEKNMSKAYNLFVNDVRISNFSSVLESHVASFADTISIKNSVIKGCDKGILLNKETNDKGDYNAEFLIIENTSFIELKEEIVDYYRGGYDESTIGGNLIFNGNTVSNCGYESKDHILIKNRGIVNVTMAQNSFENNDVNLIAILWGEKNQVPENNTIVNSGNFKTIQNLKLKLMY